MYLSYLCSGRPGYDYTAATRRTNLFDGYTGFAIYSSISQGLDEITYGVGRRSRRSRYLLTIKQNRFKVDVRLTIRQTLECFTDMNMA